VSAEGQRRLVTELVSREWGRLVAYVRSLVDDAADRDAEDIVQDVVESFLERAEGAEPISNLAAYLYRSLRNRALDVYRGRKPPPASLDDTEPDWRYEAAREVERAAEEALLDSALDALPEAQRAVLVATELEGRKFRELAEEWGVPIGTLLARKHRAVRALKKAIGGAG
jgi:RNA polymerase sigma factor (sigma-70 family)